MDKKRFTSTGKGLSMARINEITEARRRGDKVELTDFEEQQVRQADRTMKQMMEGVQPALDAQNQIDKVAKTVADLRLGLGHSDSDTVRVPNKIPNPALEREVRNSQNIEATVGALEDVVSTLKQEHNAAYERDQAAKSAQSRNFVVACLGTLFAALAIAAPFVIEAIKGWPQ